MATIKPNELVVLLHREKKKKLCVRVKPGKKIHTHWGVIDPNDVVGRLPGEYISTHTGERLIVLRPLLYERIEISSEFKYATQIVRPRDWGLIISYSNIRPGSRVVEIGTGSGAFTAFLCEIVWPGGYVYSYERDPDRAKIAERNLRLLGVPKVYEIKVRDVVRHGIDERNVDAVFVDIPEPWSVVKHAHLALRPGGILICYIPTCNQVSRLLTALEGFFEDTLIIDHFFREIQPRAEALRPLLKSYVFSAFIVFARKIIV